LTKGGLLKVFCDVISVLIEIIVECGVIRAEDHFTRLNSSTAMASPHLQIHGVRRKRKSASPHESGGVYGGTYGALSFPVKEREENLIVVKRAYLEDKLKSRCNRNTVKKVLYMLDGEVAGIKVFNATKDLIEHLAKYTGIERSILNEEIRRGFGYHPVRHYIVIHPQEFLRKGIIQLMLMKEEIDLFTPEELSSILEERGIPIGFKDLLVFCIVFNRLISW